MKTAKYTKEENDGKKCFIFIRSVDHGALCWAEQHVSGICTSGSLRRKKDAKILVAYFSRADENYGVGFVEKGNTQIIAEYIADYLKADSFHIRTVTPYPKNYRECTNVALEEQKKKARPALAEQIGHLTDCNSLFCIGERM